MEAHPVRIDDLHLADFLLQDLEFVAQEAKLDILGGEGVAIVELEPLTELKFVHPLVIAHCPVLCQAEGHGVAGHGLDEGVMQGITKPEGRTAHCRHLPRIEPGGGDGDV
jgi:hypothetical protein